VNGQPWPRRSAVHLVPGPNARRRRAIPQTSRSRTRPGDQPPRCLVERRSLPREAPQGPRRGFLPRGFAQACSLCYGRQVSFPSSSTAERFFRCLSGKEDGLVEIDPLLRDHAQKVIGCGSEKLLGFQSAEVTVDFVLHEAFSFRCCFLEDARPKAGRKSGRVTGGKRVTRSPQASGAGAR